MEFGIGLILCVVLLIMLMYGIAFVRMAKIRWRTGDIYTTCSAADVVPHLHALLHARMQELVPLGFEAAWWLQVSEPTRQDQQHSFHAVMFNPHTHTYAVIAPHPLPEPLQLTLVDFYNIFDTGPVLLTSNGSQHFAAMTLAGWDQADAYLPTLEQHWHLHQERIANTNNQPIQLDASAFCALGNRFVNEYRTQLLARGFLKPLNDGTLKFTLKGSWHFIRGLQQAQPRLKQMRAGQTAVSPSDNVEADVAAHLRQDAMLEQKPGSVQGKALLLLGSVALFMLSFGFHLNLTLLLTLVLVLLLHEVGHIVAMRLFGYQDLKILFIPFLGAIASGKNRNCSAGQKAIIDLAGPIPGIILALVLWYGGWAATLPWLSTFIAVLLILNYLNLLPVHPLDGGQLTNLLLVQRWPRLQLLFFVLSILAFFALAWWQQSPWLAALGFLFSFSLRQQWRESSVLRQVRLHHAGVQHRSETEQLQAVYTAITESKFPWPFATRMQAARNIRERLATPLPTLRESTIGMSFYLLALIGVPALLLPAMQLSPTDFLSRHSDQAEDWEAEIAAASTWQEQFELLLQAGQESDWTAPPETALPYFQRAEALLQHHQQELSLEMTQLKMSLAYRFAGYGSTPDPATLSKARQYAVDALNVAQALPSSTEREDAIATALEFQGSLTEQEQQLDAALEFYQQALAIREQSGAPDLWGKGHNQITQAKIFARQGDSENADVLFLQALEGFAHLDDNLQFMAYEPQQAYLDFNLDQQRYAIAIAVADEFIAQAGEKHHQHTRELLVKKGWALLQQAEPASAEAIFTEAQIVPAEQQSYRPRYFDAEVVTQKLLAQHQRAGDGQTPHSIATAGAYAELRQTLAKMNKSIDDYLQHLDCECKRKRGGYELLQARQMRHIVQLYSGRELTVSP